MGPRVLCSRLGLLLKKARGQGHIDTNLLAVLGDTVKTFIVQVVPGLGVHMWTSLVVTLSVTMEYPGKATMLSRPIPGAYHWYI